MRPLDGVTVVALEHVIAGPFCTRQLADLGARIIKIERPGVGDPARAYDDRVRGMSSHFVWTNRSKESITLDLKQEAARKIVDQLLESADVLVQNLAPGAAARMGFSYDQLKDRYPRLIVCDISGYGADGPYRDKKAYDLLIQSESGLLSVTGTPETPSKAGCSIVDIASGMYAYTNILAALIQRGRTGSGCRIDISMLESMAEWMSFPLYYAYDGAEPPVRAGASHATIYPYGPFPAGDGKVVMLGLAERARMGGVLRQGAGAAGAQDRSALRFRPEALGGTQGTVRRDRAGILDAHRGADRRAAGRGADRQRADERHARSLGARAARARKRWAEVDTPVGQDSGRCGRRACRMSFDPRMDPIPAIGQHTEAILGELGYDAVAIEGLRKGGVI